MFGYVPLAIAWALFATPEERAHYEQFVGPPEPEGRRVIGHPNFSIPGWPCTPTPTKGPTP